MSADTVQIRAARVHDGSGAPPRQADVVVAGDRIAALRPPGPRIRGARVVDGAGLDLAPGFIDIHGHSDMALLHPAAGDLLEPFLSQGITTQVVGNCGLGVAPAPPERRTELAAFMSLIVPPGVDWSWETFGEWLAAVERARPPLNVAPLAAHGALRCAALGARPGPARGDAAGRLAAELDAALEAGALGLSAGLIYPPGMWADTEELVALCRRVAAVDGLFTCHVRGSSELAVDAEEELLEIARRTGVRTQHSHHEAFGPPYWHVARRTLEMERRAREEGVDIASDVIPYHAVNTTLLAIFPPWALDGGVAELCRRLTRPADRQRIRRDIEEHRPSWPPWRPDGWAHNLVRAGGWDNIVVLQAASDAHGSWTGRSLTAIAAAEGRPAFDVAAELVLASRGDVMARYHAITGTDDDDGVLRDLLRDPAHAIGVDVILKGRGVSHPGGHGAMPRWLGTYARDRGLVPLHEAIHKVTGLPARRLGLRGRGRIRPGAAADLVLFRADEIDERGTYERPDRPPAGIREVWVNGVPAVRAGRLLAGDAGRVLRRDP